jgi:hypothetical protein
VATRMADEFFERFAARFAPLESHPVEAAPRFPPWLLVVAVLTILVTWWLLA